MQSGMNCIVEKLPFLSSNKKTVWATFDKAIRNPIKSSDVQYHFKKSYEDIHKKKSPPRVETTHSGPQTFSVKYHFKTPMSALWHFRQENRRSSQFDFSVQNKIALSIFALFFESALSNLDLCKKQTITKNPM